MPDGPPVPDSRPAVRRWEDDLAAWAIDPEILAAASESPFGFPRGMFDARTGPAATRRVIDGALPDGGTLIDIGCGGGAASVGFAERAGLLIAVDSAEHMLASYRANTAGGDVRTVLGDWPAVAAELPAADVAVAANVVYNVPDLAPFLAELTTHARRRVVVELTDLHPWTGMSLLWKHFHGQDRPTGPSADDFGAVLDELGVAAEHETYPREAPWRDAAPDVVVEFTRRRLCLPVARQAEVEQALREQPADQPGTATTYWWDV